MEIPGIDLAAESLLWKTDMAPDAETDCTHSQFAIVVDSGGASVVVFPGSNSGAFGVGAP